MDFQAVTVPELLQWFDMIREQRFKLLDVDDFDMIDGLVLQMTAAMREIIGKMDFQVVTVPELLQWFDVIRGQHFKLLAENEPTMNAELVHEISVAMGEMTEKMVSLIRGTSLATASQLDPSSSAETTGTSAATVKENNNSAGPIEPHSAHQSDRTPTPSSAKESHPTEYAGPSVATFHENNKPAITIAPKTFHEISFPPMLVAAKASQVAGSAGGPAAQDQLSTLTKSPKKAKWNSKGALKDRKQNKEAHEVNSSAGDQAVTRIAEWDNLTRKA